MERSIYKRLTRKKRSFIGFSQLWLAPDHLLLVRSTRFSEHYQRFSLADIQAIVVTELPDQPAAQIAVVAAVVIGAVGFFSVTALFGKILLAVLGVAGLAALARNIALGPRASCHLHTAVSRELLSPVTRVRAARKFLDRLRPAIEAAQGVLTPERAAVLDLPSEILQEKPPEVPGTPGYLPEVLFLLFLVNAAIVLASVRFPQAQLSGILFTTISGEIVILVVSLMRRAGRDSRRFIYALMIGALVAIGWDAYHVGSSFVGWINGAMEAARRGQQTPPSLDGWVAFTHADATFAAVWRITAGAAGLALAWLERR